MKSFDLRKRIIRIILVITIVFSLIIGIVISTYSAQIKRYEEIVNNITSTNNISVRTKKIIDEDIYNHLMSHQSMAVKNEIIVELDSLKKDVLTVKSFAYDEEELNTIRNIESLINTFCEECLEVLDSNTMKEKLIEYEELDAYYEFIIDDINSFITLQINNRQLLIKKLDAYKMYSYIVILIIISAMVFSIYFYGMSAANKTATIVDEEIIKRKNSEKKFKYLANYDQLTLLANRFYFIDKVNKLIKNSDDGDRMCMFFIDLDGFKLINDTYGHDAGDYVLKEIGKRLIEEGTESDIVARMGGDEFCVFKSKCSREMNADKIGVSLINNLSEGIEYENKILAVSASIGISQFPENGRDYDVLVSKADNAMYTAKNKGKNQYYIYNE